jgi:hypothetical protein
LTHAVRHGSPGPRTADSYQCASAVSPRGWQDYFSLPHHAQTEAFSGVRTPQASAWFGVQVGDEDGKESPGILGRFNSTAESALLLGSGVYREAGSLEVEAKDGIGFEASTVGRYWCLDGPYSIGSGTVTQSNTNVSASDLKWSATIEHGLLLRLKSANVRTEGFTIRTPSESFRLVADAESAAFCTHVTGPFSIEIQRLDSTGIGAWSWSLEVFDASLPGLKCSGWD